MEPELASDPDESLALEPVLNEFEFKELEESPEPDDAEESHGVTVVVRVVGAAVGGAAVGDVTPTGTATGTGTGTATATGAATARSKASASTRPRVRIMPTDKYKQCQEVNANDFGT